MKNLVIVGANEGIGYYMVEKLLNEGNKVAVLDINLDNISKLRQKYKNSLLLIEADATNEESLKKAIMQSKAFLGNIDIAIHNACICTFDSEINTDYETYKKVMDVNFFGALRLSKLVLPYMREQGYGKIIFTSSGVGVTGFGNISPYASSKGAIESLAKCLEIENQKFNISFHIIHPPLTQTKSSSGLPIPKEFMAKPEVVGKGLAKNIDSNKFIICHSLSQSLQMRLCYRHPLYMGKMMWKITQRAKNK